MQSEYIDFYYIQATSKNASWTPGPGTDMDELHPVCLVGPAGTLNVQVVSIPTCSLQYFAGQVIA